MPSHTVIDDPHLPREEGETSRRARAAENLPVSEERWQAIFENSFVGIALTDEAGFFLAANAAYRRMLGYDEAELRTLSLIDVTHADDREGNRALVTELLERKREEFLLEKRCRRRDGTVIWVRSGVFLVPSADGKSRFIMAIDEDITERRQLQDELQRERDRLRLLLELNNTIVSNLDLPRLFQVISTNLRRFTHCDSLGLYLPDTGNNHLRLSLLDFPEGRGFLQEEMQIPIEGSLAGLAYRAGKPMSASFPYAGWLDPSNRQILEAETIYACCSLPLISRDRVLGILQLHRRILTPFTAGDVEFLGQAAAQVAIAMENALDYRRLTESRERLAEERIYLKEEIRTEHNFEEIIGASAALRCVLKKVETVAPTDSTVLILGETGTGKELIARAIHSLSPRHDHAFVKLNCAAIPLGLLESELFGHEKGSFTGAIAQKIGRFEIAHRGTLFLDEVGDIPLELQPKLLRVLQEQEFERLGSARTLHADVRVIAATSRDLQQMVEEREFRGDLYYRLNIFPIIVPPLRERSEDIPSLVRHFVEKYARRMAREIQTIPAEIMNALIRYSWPGNVRELQNIIERAVILSNGTVLRVSLSELKRSARLAPGTTLAQTERAHIVQVLGETNWVVGGPNGAAARLGLKRTTLLYKMQKLGISRQRRA